MPQEKFDNPASNPHNDPRTAETADILGWIREGLRRSIMLTPVLAVLSMSSANCSDNTAPYNPPVKGDSGIYGPSGADRGIPEDRSGKDEGFSADSGVADSPGHDKSADNGISGDTKPSDLAGADTQSSDSLHSDTKAGDSSKADLIAPDTHITPDKNIDGAPDASNVCPKILNFSLNTSPTGGKVENKGLQYTLRLPLSNVDKNSVCTLRAESSNANDPGLLNGSSSPISITPTFVTTGLYNCDAVYTSPSSDYGHTVTFHAEVTTAGGCKATQTVSYIIENGV